MADIPRAGKPMRNSVEDSQAEMLAVQADLDEVVLRVRLAIRRSASVADVLLPALDRLAGIDANLKRARHSLSAAWWSGQARRWEDDQ